MPTRSFDVVILGGGNAGMGVTVATREAGLTVAMIRSSSGVSCSIRFDDCAMAEPPVESRTR